MSISEKKKTATHTERDVTLYPGDIRRGIRKFWWLSVTLAILFGGIALYWSNTRFVPLYQASATFTVLMQDETLSGNGDESAYSFSYSRTKAEQLAAAFQYAAQSSILQKKVCEALDVSTMPASLSVAFAEGTNLMTVFALGQDPEQTYEALLAFAEHYDEVTAYIIGSSMLITISAPKCPPEPYNTQTWQKAAVVAALLGLALGTAWIALYAIVRQTIRTGADIRRELDQVCIGVLPQVSLKRHKRRTGGTALLPVPGIDKNYLGSLRILHSAVQNALRSHEKVMLITSTAPDEGKSTITLDLAVVWARNDKRVLVLDADLRNSGIPGLLPTEGMKYSAENSETSDTALYHIQNCGALGIDVLTFDAQTHHPGQIIRTGQIRKIVNSLKEQYDLVLIDTPPCGMIADAAIIADAADVALYVIRQDTVLTAQIRSGLDDICSAGIRVIGCVLNGVSVHGYDEKGTRK